MKTIMRLMVCGALAALLMTIPAQAEGPTPLLAPSPAPSPFEPGSPVAITGASTVDAQHGTVQLGGAVGPHNLATEFWIEYGQTTAYEVSNATNHAATLMRADSIVVPVAMVLPLFDLGGTTTYHYRITAQNSMGTVSGVDQTFTTPPAPVHAPIPHHPAVFPAPVQAVSKPHGTGSSCAHPFKLVVHRNGDSSTGDRKHIRAIVSNIGIEWLPIAPKVVICEVRGTDTNGKHWRVTGHPHGTHHSFAHGALLQTATITARVKG